MKLNELLNEAQVGKRTFTTAANYKTRLERLAKMIVAGDEIEILVDGSKSKETTQKIDKSGELWKQAAHNSKNPDATLSISDSTAKDVVEFFSDALSGSRGTVSIPFTDGKRRLYTKLIKTTNFGGESGAANSKAGSVIKTAKIPAAVYELIIVDYFNKTQRYDALIKELENTSMDDYTEEVIAKFKDIADKGLQKYCDNEYLLSFFKSLSINPGGFRGYAKGGAKHYGSDTVNITDFWSSNGGTDKTPKTDLQLGSNNISLKKEGGAQLMSGKAGEVNATFASATKMVIEEKGLAGTHFDAFSQTINEITDEFLELKVGSVTTFADQTFIKKINALVKEEEAKLKANKISSSEFLINVETIIKQTVDKISDEGDTDPEFESSREYFQKVLGNEKKRRGAKGQADTAKIKRAFVSMIKALSAQQKKNTYVTGVDASLIKLLQDRGFVDSKKYLQAQMADAIDETFKQNKGDFELSFLNEACYGTNKFSTQDAIANMILVFDDDANVKEKSHDQYNMKLNVSFKSAGNEAFVALRLQDSLTDGLKHQSLAKKQLSDLYDGKLTESDDITTKFTYSDVMDVLEEKINDAFKDELLLEWNLGNLKTITGNAKKRLAKVGKSVFNKVKSKIKSFLSKLKTYVKKMVQKFKMDEYFGFFGVQPDFKLNTDVENFKF